MCPSYMVTREEKHSTRGRARLLWEMLQRQVNVKNGWRDEAVNEALDLCLACKGCKSGLPGQCGHGDIQGRIPRRITIKGRLRPVHAYAFGLIHVWARLAAIAPGLVNFFNRAPFISDMVKTFIGVAPQREMPAFAGETFKSWFRKTHGGAVVGR